MVITPVWSRAETKLVPSLSVSQRYDSNVFFGFAPPGKELDDYVTNVSPQLMLQHRDQFANVAVTGGASGETYVKNPGLNYIGTNASMTLNLDNSIKRLMPRASLAIADSFLYTPQPPAFFTPGLSDPIGAENAFIRGIQTFRINSMTNNGTVNGGYLLSRSASLHASYNHSIIKFGSGFGATGLGGGTFNTTMQRVGAGVSVDLTQRDKLSLDYQQMMATYGFGSSIVDFDTKGGTLTWRRVLSPSITTELMGGMMAVEPGYGWQYIGSASLTWKEQNTSATLQYTRSVFPSFYVSAVPLITQMASVAFAEQLTPNLTLAGNVNYARSDVADTSQSLNFNSYGGGAQANYAISRVLMASLGYTYMKFGFAFGGQELKFDRHVATLTLKGTWN